MKRSPERDFLERLNDFGIKLGLDKTFNLLEHFNNPHLKFKSILIGGTNGKGSVARSLSHVLTSAGYSTGLYTSPHLLDVRERISLNGSSISEDDFTSLIRRLSDLLKDKPEHMHPTFFEAITTLAIQFFAEKKIDIAVAEVGMGGRFDATNVLPSAIEIITRIGLDHTAYLGKSYQEIASEKAGIIKPHSKVICSKQIESVIEVIKKKAKAKRAKLFINGEDFKVQRNSFDDIGQQFSFYGDVTFKNLKTSLLGKHQIDNMSLVVEAVCLLRKDGFKISDEVLRSSLASVEWRGRLQLLSKNPLIILDGAHNPDGVRVFLSNLKELFPGKKFAFLVGILKDKDWKKMLNKLCAYNPDSIIFTMPGSERAINPDILAAHSTGKVPLIHVIPDVSEAYSFLKSSGGCWGICGSLYLCGDILRLTGEDCR